MIPTVESSGVYDNHVPYVKEKRLQALAKEIWHGDFTNVAKGFSYTNVPDPWIRITEGHKTISIYRAVRSESPTYELRVVFNWWRKKPSIPPFDTQSITAVDNDPEGLKSLIHPLYLDPNHTDVSPTCQEFIYRDVQYRVSQPVMELVHETIEDRYNSIIQYLVGNRESLHRSVNFAGTELVISRIRDTHHPARVVVVPNVDLPAQGSGVNYLDKHVVPRLRVIV